MASGSPPGHPSAVGVMIGLPRGAASANRSSCVFTAGSIAPTEHAKETACHI
jgi:hypothetical protein